MHVNPRQSDPQFQSPTEGDSEQASQFGMASQADVPGHDATSTQPRPVVPNPALAVGASSIVPGAEVYGSDGQKVGAVEEVYDDSFLVQKGIFFVRDYYIPLQYVAGVSNDRLDLSLTSDEAKSQNWTSRPGAASASGGPSAQPPTQPPTASGVYGPQGPEDTIQAATQRGENGAGVTLEPRAATPRGVGQPAGTAPAQGPQAPDTQDTGTPMGSATPLQDQVPASGAKGRAGEANTLPLTTNRDLRGLRGGGQEELTGPPEPTSPNERAPERQGVDNP